MFKIKNNQPFWVKVGGLLMTPLILIILELVAYFFGRFEFPGPLYFTGVICATLVAGFGWGLFNVMLVMGHALLTTLMPGKGLSYEQTKFVWLLSLVISFGLMILLFRLWQNYQKQNKDLSSTNAELNFLAKASKLLADSLDYETILANLTQLAVPELADSTTIYRLNDDQTLSRAVRSHRYADLEEILQEIDRQIPVNLSPDSPLVKVIKTGQVVYIPEFDENQFQFMTQDKKILELLMSQEVKNTLLVPLIARGKVLGVLGMLNTYRSGREFTPATRQLAEEFAQRIVQALDKSRLYQEAQIAARQKEEAFSQLNSLMESLPIGLAFANNNLECEHLNQTMAELVGGKVADFDGKSILNIIPQTASLSETMLRQVLETGQPMLNIEVNGADWGLPNFYLLNYYPVRQRDGQIVGVGTALLDVTERKLNDIALRHSEERFHKMFNHAPIAICVCDMETGAIVNINEAIARNMGLVAEEVIGKTAVELGWSKEEELIQMLTLLSQTGSFENLELRLTNFKNGKDMMGLASAVIIELDGRPSIVVIFQDITELKETEEARRQSDARFAKIFNSTPLEMSIRDLQEGRYITVNQTMLRNRLVTLEEIVGKTTVEMGWSSEAQYSHFLKVMQQEGAVHNMEVELRLPTGNTAYGLASGETIELDGQACFVTIFQDITAQKKSEAALRQREREFKTLVENSPDLIGRYDRQLRHIYVSPVIKQITGQPPEYYLGRTLRETGLTEARLVDWETRASKIFETSEPQLFDFSTISPTGKRYFQTRAVPEFGPDGQVESLLAITRDLTELKLATRALSESEAKFRAIAETIPAGISLYQDWQVIYHNPAMATLTGYALDELTTEVGIQSIRADHRPFVLERGQQRMEGLPVPDHYELPLLTKHGEERWVYTSVGKFEFQGKKTNFTVMIDITERKKAEEALRQTSEQLRQSQKMEAVGQLAGGIAHDFNNLLTGISGYSRLIQMRTSPDDRTAGDISEVINAADRAAKLTAQLLAFSRKTILQPKQLQLNNLVHNLERLLEPLIGEDVELVTKFEPELGIIRADPGQLEQVIMNLVVNARDALPKGGKVVIETANVELDEVYTAQHEGSLSGKYVMLTVSDNGQGIPPQILERIFDPFFTTKEVGKGTGLGLSTVYGIVKQSGGNIWVYSEVGVGTTFKIYLPHFAAQPIVESSPKPVVLENLGLSPQRGTILLVEDEELVRTLTSRVLMRSGYEVIEAKSGPEALQLVAEKSLKPDMLLTDLIMPKMSGGELARQLTAQISHLKVLYITGYSENGVVKDGMLDESTNLLLKPYTPDALLARISQALLEG